MKDVDDFDPLDDILLSDEEFHETKKIAKNAPSILLKTQEIAINDESKEEKKRRMLAELFGTNESSKQLANTSEETIVPVTKSDWLDLKNKTPDVPENITGKSVSWQASSEISNALLHNATKSNIFTEKLFNSEKNGTLDATASFALDTNISSDRRKSESSGRIDVKRSKQRFKSLDLDLEFDFDKSVDANVNSSNAADNVEYNHAGYNFNQSETKSLKSNEIIEPVETESLYVPSSGVNRRTGVSQERKQTSEKPKFPFVAPGHVQRVVNPEIVKDVLPTWLEPKKMENNFSRTGNSTQQKQEKNDLSRSNSSNALQFKNAFHEEGNKLQTSDKSEDNVLSDVVDLKKKQETLKNIAKTQTDALIEHEKEIQNSAIKLLQYHRNNINALMQIILAEKTNYDINEKSNREDILKKIEHLETTISQLQIKLFQQECEKSEFKFQFENVVKKSSTDIALLEDLYNCKLRVAEEKESYLKKKTQDLEEEYNFKFQRQKENEEEIIRSYKEKIKKMQEEHLDEMKYIAEYHSTKFQAEEFHSNESSKNIMKEKAVSKDLVAKEIALENKQKELIEFEEELNRRKVSLEGRIAGLEAKIEDFEARSAKEKLNIEQQKKDLKLSKTIFEEKETCWEREKQREKEYLYTYKQELETLKKNLLDEEKKLMKEKFAFSTEKARLEAIINLNDTSGQSDDILQNKAKLQGTIEEVNNLKAKLESEREDVKKEERRLKEESWKLKDIEQQLMLQNKHFHKLLNESEMKRDEGIQALKKAQRIESQINERMDEVEKRLLDLKMKEDQLIKEKMEISKDRDLLNRRKYQLEAILPPLTYEEQLPFHLLSKNIIDPKIMIMKLKAENDMDSLL